MAKIVFCVGELGPIAKAQSDKSKWSVEINKEGRLLLLRWNRKWRELPI